MSQKQYQVWTEDEAGNETAVLFTGTKTAAHRFYKQNGGARAGLHIGYLL